MSEPYYELTKEDLDALDAIPHNPKSALPQPTEGGDSGVILPRDIHDPKPHKCPVCDGSGKYIQPTFDGTVSFMPTVTCHGCAGKGWVMG